MGTRHDVRSQRGKDRDKEGNGNQKVRQSSSPKKNGVQSHLKATGGFRLTAQVVCTDALGCVGGMEITGSRQRAKNHALLSFW